MFETAVIIFILGNLFLKKFVNNLDITKVLENFTLYSEFSHENYDQLIAGNLKMKVISYINSSVEVSTLFRMGGGGGVQKGSPYQFFYCNFYKRKN